VSEECQILGVVLRVKPTDPDLRTLAEKLSLPVFQPEKVNDQDFVRAVKDMAPDLNLSVSYDQILRPDILQTARMGFANFHTGMLPSYRGRNVINWAIINGEKKIGMTAHFVDEGIDTGDIILQRELPISWTDTYRDLLDKVVDAYPDLVVETVALLAAGQAEPRRQSHLMGSYFPRRGEGDEWLDWADSSENLHNKVRAISKPGPGARTLLGNKVVTIWSAYYDPEWPRYLATPGHVVGRSGAEGVWVKTGDSTLLVREVQIAGGKVHVPQWRVGKRLGVNLLERIHRLEKELDELGAELDRRKVKRQDK